MTGRQLIVRSDSRIGFQLWAHTPQFSVRNPLWKCMPLGRSLWNLNSFFLCFFFSTFQLNCDAALQLFIETLLHNTNASQSQGDASRESARQQHSKLLAKAVEMVPLLSNTKDLVISLSGILHKVDEQWSPCIKSFQTALLRLINLLPYTSN